jgi:hypothetical protein
MLFFGLTFAAGIAAVLGAQKLDIECVKPPAKRIRRRQKAARGEASPAFVSRMAFLRQQ